MSRPESARSSARYRIVHQTCYRYPDPVAICQNQIRMLPRSFDDVRCHWVHCEIDPEPDYTEQHDDYFGNRVFTFVIEGPHQQLTVNVRSEVTVRLRDEIPPSRVPSWQSVVAGIAKSDDENWLTEQEFVQNSPLVRREKVFAEYAAPSFTQGRPVLDAAVELTERIHEDFRYDTNATNVTTSPAEAFRLKAGVCQDFSHVQIACLRSLGLPARYVSGYLRTDPPEGESRLVGSDESHAWVSLYAGPRVGWVGLDPTNACVVGTSHIPICYGRDYSDVSPMRGVVTGGGQTELTVSVDVRECPLPKESPA